MGDISCSRRSFLSTALAMGGAGAIAWPDRARGGVINDKLAGDLTPTHDPCAIKEARGIG